MQQLACRRLEILAEMTRRMVPIALDWRLASVGAQGEPLDTAAQQHAKRRAGFKDWADVCTSIDHSMAHLQLRLQNIIKQLQTAPLSQPPPFSTNLVQLFVESELAAAQLKDSQVKGSPASIHSAEPNMLASHGKPQQKGRTCRPPAVCIKSWPPAMPSAHTLPAEALAKGALESPGCPDLPADHKDTAAMRMQHDVLSQKMDATPSDPHATMVCVAAPSSHQARPSGSSTLWVQYGPAALGNTPKPGQASFVPDGLEADADGRREVGRFSVPVETWVQVKMEQDCQLGSDVPEAAAAEGSARNALGQLNLTLAPSVSCTPAEALLAIHEAILDEEDLGRHEHKDRLNQLRTQFWLLRDTLAAQERFRCQRELAARQQAVDVAAPSDAPVLRLQVEALKQRLAAVLQEHADMSQAASMVRPSEELARHYAKLRAQAGDQTRVLSGTPAAMYEQRWLLPVDREINLHAPEGHDGMAGMLHAASTIDMLCPSLASELSAPQDYWDYWNSQLQCICPKPWHDSTRPGHVNLTQELAGHWQRELSCVDTVDLTSRSPLMDLQVRQPPAPCT